MGSSLKRYALIAIVAAVATIGLKGGAYLVTGSVGLLSDALESLVNLAAAMVALLVLSIAARPPDEEHEYGHSKAEYFSSGFEGALVLIAALSIGATAIDHLLHPESVEAIGIGLGITTAASVINLLVARILLRAGRQHQSITLEANARHLMTDVWTSAGVIIGVGAAALTGWEWLDPAVAMVVAANIIRIGADLLRRSALGLLDTAIPAELRRAVVDILERYGEQGVRHHALRTRLAGARRFVSVHVLVPGEWTVQRGHDLVEQIEEEIRSAVPNSAVFTHLEPIEDPASWSDVQLERKAQP